MLTYVQASFATHWERTSTSEHNAKKSITTRNEINFDKICPSSTTNGRWDSVKIQDEAVSIMSWLYDYGLLFFQYVSVTVATVDWKNAIAGFLLAGVPLIIKVIVQRYQIYKSGYYKSFQGDFWIYHLSGTKNGVVREKKVNFSRGLFGSINVELSPLSTTAPALSGKLLPSASSIVYVLFYTRNKKELALLALNNPMLPDFQTTTGIISGVSVEYLPMSAFALVSRERLSLYDAAKRIPKSGRLISKKMSGMPAT